MCILTNFFVLKDFTKWFPFSSFISQILVLHTILFHRVSHKGQSSVAVLRAIVCRKPQFILPPLQRQSKDQLKIWPTGSRSSTFTGVNHRSSAYCKTNCDTWHSWNCRARAQQDDALCFMIPYMDNVMLLG